MQNLASKVPLVISDQLDWHKKRTLCNVNINSDIWTWPVGSGSVLISLDQEVGQQKSQNHNKDRGGSGGPGQIYLVGLGQGLVQFPVLEEVILNPTSLSGDVCLLFMVAVYTF